MRKALVLVMATCIMFAGCLEGLTEEIEEIVESFSPQCNDPTALNYDKNDTKADTCISEDILFNSINNFTETMDSEDAAGGFVMTMSGDMSDLDEGMGMDSMEGGFTIVSTTASDSNTRYSSTDVKMNGMTVLSQSWMGKNTSTGEVSPVLMVIQADTPDGEFLMNSAMSWEDFLADADGQMSDDSDEEPDAAFYFLNIDTDSDNLVTWDEIENFVIEADGGWDSDEDRDEVNQDFINSDENADGFLDGNEFEFFFGEDEDDGDDMDEEEEGDMDMDMDMDMDLDVDGMMDDMFSMFDGIDEDCDASMDDDCGFPEASTVVLSDGVDGFTFSAPVEDGQTMDMTFDCDFYTIDVNGCTMTGFSMDMEDGSEMVLEILTVEEVAALLTIDTTLGYEALPFTLEEADAEHDDVFICDNGQEIPASWVNDGMDNCGDNSDEGVEEQEEGPLNRTFTVTSDAEFAFAGSFDDYSIVFANCVEETDDMGDTTLTCDENNSTMYGLADSSTEGRDNGSGEPTLVGVVSWGFHDSDSSGTLTNGDVIIVDGNFTNWTHVRLHSTSADAYSDENPMQQLPGFTTILGALSLMGAAMMGRRD